MAGFLQAITPGEILREEFLVPMGVSQNKLARAIGVPPTRIKDIIHGRRRITPDTAARLAIYFRTTPDLWLKTDPAVDIAVSHES